jgi:molybdopterin molybdotransferase
MKSVTEALAAVLAEAAPLGLEQVHLGAARGRVLARPLRADRDVPPFRNSAMDGFALRADDLGAAGATALRLVGTIGAGDPGDLRIGPGTAAAIMTGAVVPADADTVVRLEDCRREGDTVFVDAPPARGANVREPGEDVRSGEIVLQPPRELRAADIGLAASLGTAVVQVWRQPVVAVLATGDELVDLGQPLAPGQIANSNAYTLAAAVEEAGGLPRLYGIVGDSLEATKAAFADACSADAVLSTGGVSMGSFDLVRQALREIGVVERFWKVAQKPGKPLSFGMCGRVPFFGLPGNPVSSLVCFYLYVRPALRRMAGHPAPHLPVIRATLTEGVRTAANLTEFVRVALDEDGGGIRARPTGTQSSGVLRSMSLCDGLAMVPPGSGLLAAGAVVDVLRLDGPGVATPPFR